MEARSLSNQQAMEQALGKLIYLHEADRRGHFAAWEHPKLFADEVRAAFRSLRPAHCPKLSRKTPAPRYRVLAANAVGVK